MLNQILFPDMVYIYFYGCGCIWLFTLVLNNEIILSLLLSTCYRSPTNPSSGPVSHMMQESTIQLLLLSDLDFENNFKLEKSGKISL